MLFSRNQTFTKNEATTWLTPNYWDILALCLVLGLLALLAWGAAQMSSPYQIGQTIPISLSPTHLPYYALRTILRMLIALFFSLAFTFVFGTWAAKSKQAERILIPTIDILQSVPVLSFLYITTAGFIALFPGSLLGPECAAIFAIFTSQVWNMTFSVYQSMQRIPHDLQEASRVFQLTTWRRFCRVEVPFAMPGLLWNTMMSMSGSWFFVTASEAISINHQTIALPGIGSYIALAIAQTNKEAIVFALLTMFIVIFLYDQIMFRPLVAWIDKFQKEEESEDASPHASWITLLFQRTRALRQCGYFFVVAFDRIVNWPLLNKRPVEKTKALSQNMRRHWRLTGQLFLALVIAGAAVTLVSYLSLNLTWHDVTQVMYLGLLTGARVIAMIIIASLVWVPIGVWIGLRPRATRIAQPLIQFLAAFPANLLFPVAAFLILRYKLNINVWTSPLMVLGTQWYILFNVIAGASSLPKDLQQAAQTFKLSGWLWWKRLILPGIFPFFVTGAITAAGGAWNASIIAEAITWGSNKLYATGLGAYIKEYTMSGSFPHVLLGTAAMCLFVLVLNRLIWRPLYNLSKEHFRLE